MTSPQQADQQDDGHEHPRSRHGDHREQGAGVTGDVVGADLRPFQRGRSTTWPLRESTNTNHRQKIAPRQTTASTAPRRRMRVAEP